MKGVLLAALMTVLLATGIGLNWAIAKRFDSASPRLASSNGTSESSETVECPGHKDFVKSKDNSTTKTPEEYKD